MAASHSIPDGAGGYRQPADADLPANMTALLDKGPAALTANATYQAIGSPSTAQVTAQVAALTKQINALMRIALGIFDSTTGT